MADAPGDDVGVDAAVAVAVERPIVDDDGVLHARDDVGARAVVEQHAEVANVPPKVVGKELVGTGFLGEYACPPRPADQVTSEHVAGHHAAGTSKATGRRANAVEQSALELISGDPAVAQSRRTEASPPRARHDVVGDDQAARVERPNAAEYAAARGARRHDGIPLDASAVHPNRKRNRCWIWAIGLNLDSGQASVGLHEVVGHDGPSAACEEDAVTERRAGHGVVRELYVLCE